MCLQKGLISYPVFAGSADGPGTKRCEQTFSPREKMAKRSEFFHQKVFVTIGREQDATSPKRKQG